MTQSPLDELFGATSGDFLDEEGTFLFEVTKATATSSKTSSKPALKLNMKVVEGPNEGKTQNHQLTYSPENPNALSIFNRSLQALGITPEFAKEVAGQMPPGAQIPTLLDEAAKILTGRRVIAECAKDKNNPREEYRERIKVQWDLKPAPAAATAPPTPAPAPAPQAEPTPAPQPEAAPATVNVDEAPPF